MIKLVSTTLTGSNENDIEDALKSVVNHVDECIVIDTGVKDKTLDVAKEIAGDKLKVFEYEWDNNFSNVRNFSLKMAEEAGATHALTLDTDERLIIHKDLIAGVEYSLDTDVFLAYTDSGSYAKERIIRLPLKLGSKWSGPTHECFTGPRLMKKLLRPELLVFSELDKNSSQSNHKFTRDVEILEKYIKEVNNKDSRWFFYLGESYRNLGKFSESMTAYRNCIRLSDWDEERGWSCYCIALCYTKMKKYDDAVEACMKGMVHYPGMAEFIWLAGWNRYQQQKYRDAIFFAEIAKTLNKNSDTYKSFPRSGFRLADAYMGLPYNLAKYAWEKLGYKELSDKSVPPSFDS